ncbi:ABC transporter ATP-binding protein [Arthrobacter sp. ISL-72]|uniref:ABC transporter ATP-binding protein n=1 Tax=Arthrobacter sp. ISL-72 TaxID=2819114 RepID=UPI001BE7B451|nr:ABC transporter ATP-binding protein [Arthrobacter sp. ISL-72]MBT2596908.1 ATP-binding cassette domain-containing protein [Arthrobacter sp. ISL-72]
MKAAALLQAGITEFSYHGEEAPVLRDIEIAAAPGTLTAVLGGSGSGKSTLGKLLAGWMSGGHSGLFRGTLHLDVQGAAPGGDSSPLVFRGSPDDPRINPALWSRHVGYVPQDAAALLSTVGSTVAEELAFGLENRGVNRQLMQSEVERAAEAAGLTALLDRDPATLSGGELRRLAMACSAITRPCVLVLDEPLGSLDHAGAQSVRALVRSLLESGTAVIVLTQTVDELGLAADHWLVLDGGTVTARGAPGGLAASAELLQSGVVLPAVPGYGFGWQCRAVAPRGADSRPATPRPDNPRPATPRPADPRPAADTPAVLELERVSFAFPAGRGGQGRGILKELSLAVRSGEVVAVTGPNGAGKSTLLRHFNGLLRPGLGTVRVLGADIRGVPTGRVADKVGLLFQHPRDQLFERTVLREVLFGLDRKYGPEAAGKARAALTAVGLGEQLETHPHELPASAQRLLALATVLAREPDVIALDEPTVGLDRHGLERLDDAVRAATERDAAVVMVTHELAYARQAADRILELRDGSLREL